MSHSEVTLVSTGRENLASLLMPTPAATFLMRVAGSCMQPGVFDGDLAVVDRSRIPEPGNVVVAAVVGGFVIRRLVETDQGWVLRPDSAAHSDIVMVEDVELFGVVSWTIHALRRRAPQSPRSYQPDAAGGSSAADVASARKADRGTPPLPTVRPRLPCDADLACEE